MIQYIKFIAKKTKAKYGRYFGKRAIATGFKVPKKSFSNIAITGMAQNRNPLPIPKGCPREAIVPDFK